MAIKNRTASVLARLKNQAKTEGISYQMALQLFVQEEFLRRLAMSKYKENLVLKGGMFIYTLTEFDSRPTQDMDFLMRRLSNDLNNIESVMAEICSIETENDFIKLEVTGTEQIALEKKYPGVKTRFIGRIENIRIPFSIDVGIDDIIVPGAMLRKFTTRLSDFEAKEIYTYSLESTIAEKFDAILMRMETTSRMKDFYDIYYLSGIFDFDGAVLSEALKKTLAHRNRAIPENAFERILSFDQNSFLLAQWASFKPAKETGLTFTEALTRIGVFIRPVFEAVVTEQPMTGRWISEKVKWI